MIRLKKQGTPRRDMLDPHTPSKGTHTASKGRSQRSGIMYHYLKPYHGKPTATERNTVKIKVVDGEPVSEVIDDKHYLLFDDEKQYYLKQINMIEGDE